MREGLSTNSGNALADGNGLGKCLVGIPRSVGFGSIVGHCAGTGDGQVVTGVDSPVDGVGYGTGVAFKGHICISEDFCKMVAYIGAVVGSVHPDVPHGGGIKSHGRAFCRGSGLIGLFADLGPLSDVQGIIGGGIGFPLIISG